MASFSAYALSTFFLVLFFTSIVVTFQGAATRSQKQALRCLFTTVAFGLAAYLTAWLGGI